LRYEASGKPPVTVSQITKSDCTTTASRSTIRRFWPATTVFDIRVQNEIDRFLPYRTSYRQTVPSRQQEPISETEDAKLIQHKLYIDEHGEDLPEIRNWVWGAAK
jgi:phosphoketolase